MQAASGESRRGSARFPASSPRASAIRAATSRIPRTSRSAPTRVSYEELLDSFWKSHNPTTKDRQGLDIGTQYRSAVFFHSPEQQAAAERTKEREQSKLHWPRKIVTEVVPASEFYEAEDYHQQYLEKRGRASCTPELAQVG